MQKPSFCILTRPNPSSSLIHQTAVIHNDHEDSTQQPLPPIHQPGWDAEEIYPTNTSRDGILMGVDSDSEGKQTGIALNNLFISSR